MSFDSFNSGPPPIAQHPLGKLPREDLDLIVELVRKSGSIKDLAATYRVSYPTMRGRLDKLIERLEAAVAGIVPDPMTELLAAMVERGEVTPDAARRIRDEHRRAKEAKP